MILSPTILTFPVTENMKILNFFQVYSFVYLLLWNFSIINYKLITWVNWPDNLFHRIILVTDLQ